MGIEQSELTDDERLSWEDREKKGPPKVQLDIRKGTAAGYAEALLASVNYEKDRNRRPVPSINIGLSKVLSGIEGVQNIQGAIQFAEDMGLDIAASDVLRAHKEKKWLGIHEGTMSVYVSDEPFESNSDNQ